MPSKPSGKPTASGRELPEVVPGTPAQLLGIARQVIGPPARGHPRPDPARLQEITDRLGRLGRDLLHGLQQQVTSPSADALTTRLEQVRHHAQALEAAIMELPPFAYDLFNHAHRAQRRWNPDTRTWRDLGAIPATVAAATIADTATQQLESWQRGTVVGRVPPAQRGPMRAYQRIIGDPRGFMVEQVAQLVIAEQGAAAANAEENGTVYTVIGELWEWATGLSDDDANLRKHVRQGVRDALLAARLDEVRRGIEDEIKSYHTVVMTDVAADEIAQANKARAVLEARPAHKRRLHKLEAERDRLMRRLFGSEPKSGDTEQVAPSQEKIVPG